jgi:hypothetical protein
LFKKILVLLLPLLLLAWPPGPALAQEPDEPPQVVEWQELQTEKFLVVYAERVSVAEQDVPCACGVAEAERYAGFVDGIYADLSRVFGVELQTPVNLYLFPTEESYYEVNPLAERLTGVIAHALNAREEIAIALPRTQDLGQEELVNNVRHELAHLFVSSLSAGKLSAGFQEGIAQYLEKPTAQSDYDPALLQLAAQEDRLLTWAELDQAQRVYSDPQVAYPQTLSIVAFLVDRYGLPKLMGFVEAAAQEPGYRSALETAYGQAADELEAEWLAYLPEYFDGRWKINAIYAYDLSRVVALVEKGAYSAAEAELADIIALLETTDQKETLAQAESLLARVHQGRTAAALADQARSALLAGDYALAAEKGAAAIAAYQELGYHERIPEIQVYVHRAGLGQGALDQLRRGERLLEASRFSEAEQHIYEATVTLQSLDNQDAAQRGMALLATSARRQRSLAHVALGVGALALLLNGARRALNRFKPHPLEVEFT